MENDLIKVLPGSQQIDMFLKKHGRTGSRVLSFLGFHRAFIQAISSEIGRELLKDLMSLMDNRLDLIINMEAGDNEKAEYRAYLKLFNIWAGRIQKYNQFIDKINKET